MASVVAAPPPSPAPMSTASRRVPLGTLPNAANSNYHASIASPMMKRPRSQSISHQREGNHVEKPVVKKQIVEAPPSQPIPRTPVRNRVDSKTMPPRRGTNRIRPVGGSPPPFNAIPGPQQLQRRAVAEQNGAGVGADGAGEARGRIGAPTATTNNTTAPTADNIEKIKAWQAHYRKVFPTFVFYFESLPEDSSAVRYQKQVHALGAHVEKFFSNAVTHVITTRPIPPEIPLEKQKLQASQPQRSTATVSHNSQSRAGNANVFEKGQFNGQTHAKAEFTFKASQTKKFAPLNRQQDSHGRIISYEDSRTQQNTYSTILLKAREWGIKIWALEKLQRMLNAMADVEHTQLTNLRGDQDMGNKAAPAGQDDQLSRLLRNERIHGPSDRDPDAMSKDMVYFTGPFIVVRDSKSTYRPIMVREYEKVAKREDGLWPQFRSTASGKCPFIDDQATLKEKEREREARELRELREQEKLKEMRKTMAAQQEAAREMKKAMVAQDAARDAARQRATGRMQPPVPRTARQIEAAGRQAEAAGRQAEALGRQAEALGRQAEALGRQAEAAARRTEAIARTEGAAAVARRPSRTLEDLDPQDNRPDYGRTTAAISRAQPAGAARLFNVPSVIPAKRISNEMAFTSTATANGKHPHGQNPRYAYEPAASGMQPSNITSAIRSQMISSHLDIPGAKTGMSRDMLELKRKAAGNVVNMGLSAAGDVRLRGARVNGVRHVDALAKAAPKNPLSVEKVGKAVPIYQDAVEERIAHMRERRQLAGGTEAAKKVIKREIKPGYCENCREKFEDFDDHTASRRHRKFAGNEGNFAELDDLLVKLARPLRQRNPHHHHNSSNLN